MGTILPVGWGYSGGNNMVNICFSSLIAKIFSSQHTGVRIPYSYFFLLPVIKSIAIMPFLTSTAKVVTSVSSVVYRTTGIAIPIASDRMICGQPDMPPLAFPICFRVGTIGKRAKPLKSLLFCNGPIIRFGMSLFRIMAFTTSRATAEITKTGTPNVPPTALPIRWGITIFRKRPKPNNSQFLGKFPIVRFNMYSTIWASFLFRTFKTSMSKIENAIECRFPDMSIITLPSCFGINILRKCLT